MVPYENPQDFCLSDRRVWACISTSGFANKFFNGHKKNIMSVRQTIVAPITLPLLMRRNTYYQTRRNERRNVKCNIPFAFVEQLLYRRTI